MFFRVLLRTACPVASALAAIPHVALSEAQPFAPNARVQTDRERGEKSLRDLAADAKKRISFLDQRLARREISPSEHANAMANLKRQVVAKSQGIVHGPNAAERERYVAEHGCVRHTPTALSSCAEYGPLIEIGAGAGHWQRALTLAGTDVRLTLVQIFPCLSRNRKALCSMATNRFFD